MLRLATADSDDDAESEATEDDDEALLKRIRKCFEAAVDASAEFRLDAEEDLNFLHEGEQWEEYAKEGRTNAAGQATRPMLVINRLISFRNQLTNELRMSTPEIKYRPVDDDADIRTAQMLEGMGRHIQYNSKAKLAYTQAGDAQVDTGCGYFAVLPRYVDDDSFEQEIQIEALDAFRVYYDPNSVAVDGSDARWAILIEEYDREEFEVLFPKYRKEVRQWLAVADLDENDWVNKDTVRTAEFFWIESKAITRKDPRTGMTRTAESKEVHWCKVFGHAIGERTVIAGAKAIPIIPVVGNQVIIRNKVLRYGIVKHSRSPQQLYNYAKSASVELQALQPKAPWVGPQGAFDNDKNWATANTGNHAYLEYAPVEVNGVEQFVPPSRQGFPGVPAGLLELERDAANDIQATLGMYEASLGHNPNDQSGRAIRSLQAQADKGTYQYSFNLAASLAHAGTLIADMIPHYYDTQRVVRVLGEDGKADMARIDPSLPTAYAEQDAPIGVQKLFNPGIGRYDVVADVAASYATKRAEAVDSQLELVRIAPQVAGAAMDLIVANMDWPGAEKIAERLKKTLPPNLLQGENDNQPPLPPGLQQQMDQVAQQMEHLSQVCQQLQAENDDLKAGLEVKWFEAETHRLAVMKPDQGGAMPSELDAEKLAIDREKLHLEGVKAQTSHELEMMKLAHQARREMQPDIKAEQAIKGEGGEAKEDGPAYVVRGADGEITGVHKNGVLRKVIRGTDGKVAGLE